MRESHFDGNNFKARKVPENAAIPTIMAPTFVVGDRVHAIVTSLVIISTLRVR